MSAVERRTAGDALACDVVAAFGGAAPAREITRIEADVSAGGLVFALKRQPRALHRIRAVLDADRQSGLIVGREPAPWEYRFDPERLVADMRRLSRWPRPWPWSPEHAGAFAAAALWTYLLLPLCASDPTLGRERLPDRRGLRRLRLTFPPHIATHSRVQVLHVDQLGMVRRHDYTAGIMGRWARPAHLITDMAAFDGVPVGTRRSVVPKVFGHPLPWPTLVHIDVHHLTVHGRGELD